jgi:hypothetical protein
LQEERHTSQGKQQARITRQQTTLNISPYSTDLRGRTTFIVHRNRGEQQHGFLESIGMHSKAVVQYFSGTEIEEGVGHDFLGKENPYSPYGLAQKTRVVLP